jgi:hypothetical protein
MMAVPRIEAQGRRPTPTWAVRQRDLIAHMNSAAVTFTDHATNADGTLRQYSEFPSMGGTDNGLEAFLSFPLCYLLGGDEHLHDIGRREWQAITRQYTEYGAVDREFPDGFDWFHHSESNTYLSYLALANPDIQVDRERAQRFASFYTGDDPQAPNWDADRRMIRSPLNGSRGPRFTVTARDWQYYRPLLSPYLSPFEDLPDFDPTDSLSKVDWTDDAVYEQILTRMNERMMRGDVPLNLSAAMIVTHAYLYTGEDRLRDWVIDYLQAWVERRDANGGLMPDNIGPSGVAGELNDGRWWGGYYGWRWPHGARNIVEPALVAGSCALLMTGDRSHLELCRSQLDRVWEQRRVVDGRIQVPDRYGGQGWFDFNEPDPMYYIHLAYLSQADEDRARLQERFPNLDDFEDLPPGWGRNKAGICPPTAWWKFLQGDHPDFPQAVLESTWNQVCGAMDCIDNDDEDRETLHCAHYQALNPVVSEGMVQMAMGTPAALYNGGLLQTHLFYFDPHRQRPGLPEHVAALVDRASNDSVRVHLVNTNPVEAVPVVLQAGAFGEHRFGEALFDANGLSQQVAVDGRHLRVDLGPAVSLVIELSLTRYAHRPSYGRPPQ